MENINNNEIIWAMFKSVYIERRFGGYAANWIIGEADIWTRPREWNHLQYRFPFLKWFLDIKANKIGTSSIPF